MRSKCHNMKKNTASLYLRLYLSPEISDNLDYIIILSSCDICIIKDFPLLSTLANLQSNESTT